MRKPMKNNKLIIICLFLISTSIADDGLNNLINDEYENISSRTAIDYDTKVVQAWRDSAWVNKSKKVKTYGMAVDIKHHKVEFTKLLNNTTASFIKKSKNHRGICKENFNLSS